VIQLGAILAVCWEYRARFARAFSGLASDRVQQRFALNLFVAFLPAAIVGLAFQSQIKKYLFTPFSVGVALVVGAFVIFAIEAWYKRHGAPRVTAVDEMTWKDALKVGLAQCFSLIPGTSRSGATIMGGMLFGLFSSADIAPFALGFVVSFVSALVAVKALIRYVAHHDFRGFAWYRIVLGVLVLAYFY
jgi:undecaprenyl-diphosphatase